MITIDLHGFTAEMAVKEIVKEAAYLSKGRLDDCIEVIHGYNKGSKIKRRLLEGIKCRYIRKILPSPNNEGRTYVWINY